MPNNKLGRFVCVISTLALIGTTILCSSAANSVLTHDGNVANTGDAFSVHAAEPKMDEAINPQNMGVPLSTKVGLRDTVSGTCGKDGGENVFITGDLITKIVPIANNICN